MACLVAIATPITAELSEVRFQTPIKTAKFYDTCLIGQTRSNAVAKYSITGQNGWLSGVPSGSISQTELLFNRLVTLDSSGKIECRDTNFGVKMWTISDARYRWISLQYPVFFAQTDSNEIDAFDFSTGVKLYSWNPDSNAKIVRSSIPDDGGLYFYSVDGLFRNNTELTSPTRCFDVPTGTILAVSDHQMAVLNDNIIAIATSNGVIPVFAMSGGSSNIHIPSDSIVIINDTASDTTHWIVAYPLLVEVNLRFGLTRVVDIPSGEIYLDWKECDPDFRWRSVWWDNGLLAMVNSDHVLTVWDSKSKRILGAVPWPEGAGDPLSLIFSHDFISIATPDKLFVAMVRKGQ